MTSCWQRDDNERKDKIKCPLSGFKWLLFWHSRAALLKKSMNFLLSWRDSVLHLSPKLTLSLAAVQVVLFVCLVMKIQLCSLTKQHEKQTYKLNNKGWQVWRRMWRRAEVWLLFQTRWMTGASLTCRQAPRCLLVSHCHLCQQTMSCIQPSALIYMH